MGLVADKKLFFKALDKRISEGKRNGGYYSDPENNRKLSADEYYQKISLEIKRLAEKIFSDDSLYKEQFRHYKNYSDYINDIIDDIMKEDGFKKAKKRL